MSQLPESTKARLERYGIILTIATALVLCGKWSGGISEKIDGHTTQINGINDDVKQGFRDISEKIGDVKSNTDWINGYLNKQSRPPQTLGNHPRRPVARVPSTRPMDPLSSLEEMDN